MVQWENVQHFTQREFDSPDLKGSGAGMDPLTVYRLDALRCLIDKAFRINSGYRTPAHNRVVGGEPGSAHLIGQAADIGTLGWTKEQRRNLIILARKLGFVGIGIGTSYIHLDTMQRGRKVAWIYPNGRFKTIPVSDELKYV
ncbi:D-Ala-D-Ala carboxypeptidase family metallohydrolase [Mesorhizobium sp. ASY16-5R]|uniref:D-Ala-D-Ala carboxypeptidase family metallohydrolase n=1 Tax=Mesorhizobium sp. ASY16-5R TaxID=3445772 RepID=UPI003F9F6593